MTEPLRAEHRQLLPRIELLRVAAETLEGDDQAALAGIDAGVSFLREQLIPHAKAEDAVLYPEVERVTGAPGATATMRRGYVEVERLTAELERIGKDIGAGGIDDQQRRRLRQLLYGLHAVVGLHFIKEEEIYLPALDRGSRPTRHRCLRTFGSVARDGPEKTGSVVGRVAGTV